MKDLDLVTVEETINALKGYNWVNIVKSILFTQVTGHVSEMFVFWLYEGLFKPNLLNKRFSLVPQWDC